MCVYIDREIEIYKSEVYIIYILSQHVYSYIDIYTIYDTHNHVIIMY